MARLALLCLLLAGCVGTTANDIDAATRYCAPHGGLNRIPAQAGGRDYKLVVCNDRSEATIRVRKP